MSVGARDHPPLREDAPEKTYFEDLVKIPGYGRSPNRCAGYNPVGYCGEGHVVLGKSSCGTRRCADHWRDWCEGAVIAIVARLAAYRHVQEGAEKRLNHVVVSPPQDRRWSRRELFATRSDSYDVAREAGLRGGAVVAHGYRTNERGNALFETAQEEGDLPDGTGKWRFLRDVTNGDWPDLTRYIEAAPHYHMIAPAPDVQELEASDWVVKRIRSLDRFHVRDTASYRDMARVTYYVLTHGVVTEGRATTTYFGDVHPSSFDPEAELTKTAWDRIQREAEIAVKLAPGESPGEGPSAGGPDECPRDDCEAVVRELGDLVDRLNDSDWIGAIRRQRGGRKRLARLEGAAMWWQGMTDRPPPHVASDQKKLQDWLEDVGEVAHGEPEQVGLPGVGY